VQVPKWGKSLAVRLLAAVVEALHLREVDQIEIRTVTSGLLKSLGMRAGSAPQPVYANCSVPGPPDASSSERTSMSDRVFFDSNVVIYARARRSPRPRPSRNSLQVAGC